MKKRRPEAAQCGSRGFGLTSSQIKPFHSCLQFSLNSVPEPEGMQKKGGNTDKGRDGVRIGIWYTITLFREKKDFGNC